MNLPKAMASSMYVMLRIFQNTPLWVFALLAALIFFGVQALQTRTIPVWRLLIVPVVFIGWGFVSLSVKLSASPMLIVDWLSTAAIGFAIAWLTSRLDGVRVDRSGGSVQVPGSATPLTRNLGIFTVKYCLTAAMAIAPALQTSLTPWDIAVSGISAGYFIGWLSRFALKWRGELAPQPSHLSADEQANDARGAANQYD